jgi:hypothetical protein
MGELNGMPVPTDRVRFMADENGRNGITVYIENGMLMVHADDGELRLHPRSSNEVQVVARRWSDS